MGLGDPTIELLRGGVVVASLGIQGGPCQGAPFSLPSRGAPPGRVRTHARSRAAAYRVGALIGTVSRSGRRMSQIATPVKKTGIARNWPHERMAGRSFAVLPIR